MWVRLHCICTHISCCSKAKRGHTSECGTCFDFTSIVQCTTYSVYTHSAMTLSALSFVFFILARNGDKRGIAMQWIQIERSLSHKSSEIVTRTHTHTPKLLYYIWLETKAYIWNYIEQIKISANALAHVPLVILSKAATATEGRILYISTARRLIKLKQGCCSLAPFDFSPSRSICLKCARPINIKSDNNTDALHMVKSVHVQYPGSINNSGRQLPRATPRQKYFTVHRSSIIPLSQHSVYGVVLIQFQIAFLSKPNGNTWIVKRN